MLDEGGRKRVEEKRRFCVYAFCAKMREAERSSCPLMRTRVVFHVPHPAPIGSGLVQREALEFQRRSAVPVDNEDGESSVVGDRGGGVGAADPY